MKNLSNHWKNKTLTMLVLSVSPFFNAIAAENYTCVTNPNANYCSDNGFTMSEADCVGKTVLRCPFDLSKVYCSKVCSVDYQYSCTGTGYAGGFDDACRGKYKSCSCSSGYKWSGTACIEDTCSEGYEIATSNTVTSYQMSYKTQTLTNGQKCYMLDCRYLAQQEVKNGVISCVCKVGTKRNGYEIKEIAGTCGFDHVIYTNCNNSGDSSDKYTGMAPSTEVRAKYPEVVKVSYTSGYTGDTTAPCHPLGLATSARPDVVYSDGRHKGVCFICKANNQYV